MLAAEYATLPAPMQEAVRAFFDANEAWLADVLGEGREARELAFPGAPREAARHFTSTLEGAMLLARSYGDPSRLAAVAKRLIDSVRRAPTRPSRGR
jgi:TetR/AcrR family transcriptional repressor of nem operon